MADLELKKIYKIYPGDVLAVKDFNLKIQDKEFIVFVGPSGCGKSTTLRMIAGLEDISKGELYIDGNLMNDAEPKDRDIAMVFQSYALYPHMNVYENMAFALKLRKIPKEEIEKKVTEVAKSLELEALLKRKPKDLSGGQRQRVALGRAIVRNPKVFLMDEPLSNLDTKLRVQMRKEISNLHKKLQTTFIYVTHDQVEAMTMGTRIVVMKDGVIQQVASPTELYENPENKFVASFIGSPQMNFIDGEIKKNNIICKKLNLNLDMENLEVKEANLEKQEVIIGFRPEDLEVVQENENFTGKVELCELMGSETYIHFKVNDNNFIVKVKGTLQLENDSDIKLAIKKDKIHVFDKQTEISLKITK